jgi:hypothetical protein
MLAQMIIVYLNLDVKILLMIVMITTLVQMILVIQALDVFTLT